jgi:flavin-binding protein dodecin
MYLAADYIQPTPHKGRCRVRIYRPDLPEEGSAARDEAVVICSEPKDNPGMSITNPPSRRPSLSGWGYGPLSMRTQRPSADMFSLPLLVVGKNVSSSSERASDKRGDSKEDMSVARVTEISAISEQGFEDAVQQGIARATKTLRNVEGAWVKDQNVMIEAGNITGYKVNLEVTFVLEE